MKYIDFVCPGLWVKGALHYWWIRHTHKTVVWWKEVEAIDFRDVAISPN